MPTVIIPLNEKLTAQERWAQKDAIGHLIRLATGTTGPVAVDCIVATG
jgi:hypothetical protein